MAAAKFDRRSLALPPSPSSQLNWCAKFHARSPPEFRAECFTTAWVEIMSLNDAELAAWKKQFDAAPYLADPYLSLHTLSTLQTLADALKSVQNLLPTVADGSESEQERGRVVAGMALSWACKVLDHLGVLDEDATPPPIGLKAAQFAVTNLSAFVEGQIAAFYATQRRAEPEADHNTEAPATSHLTVSRETFTAEYGGVVCDLGNTRAFALLERLNQTPGVFIHLDTLVQDVWHGQPVSDEAVQRQASTLRTKLHDAGIMGVVIDSQKNHYRLLLK